MTLDTAALLRTWVGPCVAVVVAWILLLAGCGDGAPPASAAGDANASPARADEVIEVVTTTEMIADLVRAVGGPRTSVVALMGPGVDPHLYAPTRSDAQRMIAADLILLNGHHLEGTMGDTLRRASEAGRTVVAVVEAVGEDALVREDDGGTIDPHLWMDVQIWKRAVHVVRDTLSEHDPDHAVAYAERATDYANTLDELDAYAARVLATVPEQSRVLVTAHDAFNYFGRRYGFEVVGIQGISTESEAGVRDIERLVSLLVERDVAAVFVESSVSDRNVGALVEGARAAGHTVTIGGELFSDAMGPRGTYEGTYLGMIDHNVTTIARALGGTAPEDGRIGELGP